MSWATSVAGAILLCALVGAFTNQHYSWGVLLCAALGSQLPHAFEQRWLIERLGPNTLTHSLVGLLGCALCLSPFCFLGQGTMFAAALIGYFSHLLLDAASEGGVQLFYPSQARAVLPRHPLHRIIPHSPGEQRLRRWLLGLWLIALPLNALGVRGCSISSCRWRNSRWKIT